jgi:predicted phage tail protein
MTKIYLHGILGKIFGKSFKLKVANASTAINAMNCIREGFLRKVHELSKNGCDYFLIIDGEVINNQNEFLERKHIENIHFVPALIGFGGAIVAAIVGVEVANLTAMQLVAAFLINLVISSAISLGVSFLMASINKQGAPPQQMMAIGGATSMIEARGRSYIFGSSRNEVSQGGSIPVGYGKLRVPSNTINMTISNYATNSSVDQEFNLNKNLLEFSDFLTS